MAHSSNTATSLKPILKESYSDSTRKSKDKLEAKKKWLKKKSKKY